MSLINYATKEITLKIVFYGPALGGKTTNLQNLHSILDPAHTGKLISLATETDRTLFFDFLPIELGKIRDFSIRFQVYTVPGQIRYNATRKLVLKGADAVIFVADSQRELLEDNMESLINMRENLIANNINPDEIPVVMQYNKRDLNNIMTVDELNHHLNKKGYDFIESIATKGTGVYETLHKASRLLIKDLSKKHKIDISSKEQVGKEPAGYQKENFAATPNPSRLEEIKEAAFARKEAGMESLKKNDKKDLAAAHTPARSEKIETLHPGSKEKVNLESIVFKDDDFSSKAISKESEAMEDVDTDLRGMDSSMKEIKIVLSTLISELQEKMSKIQTAREENSMIRDLFTKVDQLNNEIQGYRKQQSELLSLVKDIKKSFDPMKTKKRWFFF